MNATATGTATDVEPFVREASALLDGSQDPATFKKHWIRLVGQAPRMPGETWTYLNEIFYVVEEHVADPESRDRKGGHDDETLRHAVSSQLPALEEEIGRVRAVEEGRTPPAPVPDSGTGAGLLGLVRDLLQGTVTAPQFAEGFRDRLERSRPGLAPRVRAAVEAVGLAVAQYRPDSTPLRLYDIDETVLRARVAAVEPRLSAAVGTLR